MTSLVAAIFVLAYVCIALEHPLKVSKTATALIAAGLMWTVHAWASPLGVHGVTEQLLEKLGETAAIVFFLIGAMTIVEVTASHGGFEIIIDRIKVTKLTSLLWVIGFIAFFLSAVLDNMTTTIVMVALLRKLLKDHAQRLFFAGIIVIAANAGGAWTPIGDVTTTMLWIGGQVTTGNIMASLFLPSLACLVAPLLVLSFTMKGEVAAPDRTTEEEIPTSPGERRLFFLLGMGALVFVPVFKALTHLPPWLGILLSLGVVWLVAEIVHRNKPEAVRERLSVAAAKRRIDMPSAVFFIGILLAVAALSANGTLPRLATWLDGAVGDQGVIVIVIGLVSAVVDNIPLVAACMGMYPLGQYPADSYIWEFLAYCAGTGGSILVIGSAAGVAAMGMEKIEFFWYARKIGPLAILGYFVGVACYMVQFRLTHG